MRRKPLSITKHQTKSWKKGLGWSSLADDPITPEVPLGIRLVWLKNGQRQRMELAVTMRTPGQDAALVYGFLFAEGIIQQATDIAQLKFTSSDQVEVWLQTGIVVEPDLQGFRFANSSCGACSKSELSQLEHLVVHRPVPSLPKVEAGWLSSLLRQLRQGQQLFAKTGGIHAVARFSVNGQMLDLQEDVGRHNALDKLLGQALLKDALPWRDQVVLLTSRISFELVQKASLAGLPILAAIGAPTTAAIELAEECGMTLIGFLREERMNCYTFPERLC